MAQNYQSASGPLRSKTALLVLPQVAVAATATNTGTFSFGGAEVGMLVSISPSATLGVGAILSHARVSAANVIELTYASVSAPVTVATQSATVGLFAL